MHTKWGEIRYVVKKTANRRRKGCEFPRPSFPLAVGASTRKFPRARVNSAPSPSPLLSLLPIPAQAKWDWGNNRIRMRKGRLSLREAKGANLAWHLHLCNLEPEFIWDQNNTSRNNNIGNGLSFYGDSCPPPLLYVIALSATAAENNKSILKLLTDQVCQKRIGKRSTVRSGHFDQPVIQM